MPEGPEVAIVGAGLAGCLLARCWPAAASTSRCTSAATTRASPAPERGRSINLAISARGLDALAPGRAP